MSIIIEIIPKTKNMEKSREEAFIKINDVDEIEISEYISVLENFEEMIKETSLIAGFGDVKIKMRPIRKGSVDIRIVIEFFENMGSPGFSGVANILAYITTAISIVKFCKGRVDRFVKKDNSVAYKDESNQEKETTPEIHKIVQSPIFQAAVVEASKSLFDKLNGINSFEFGSQDALENITKSDRELLKNYKESQLDEEFEESVSIIKGLYIKPVRGSYSGENTRYTFFANQQKFYPTIIRDDDFRKLLRNGSIKLFSEDVLKVDLTTIQRFSPATRRSVMSHSIDRVHEYLPYRKTEQLDIFGD